MRAILEARGATLLIRTPFHPRIKDGLKALPTATWNKAAKAWAFTITPSTAAAIREGLTELGLEAVGDVQALYPTEEANPRIDTLQHTRGPTPWPHQIEAAFRISQFASYVHGGMGVGKTRAAVDAIINYGMQRVLVLCPSSVVTVWPKEFAKYAARPVNLIALTKKKSVPERTERVRRAIEAADAAPQSRPIIVVINYEAAWREPFAAWALGYKWDLVVLDEAHRIKSDKGKASKFCADLRGAAKRVTGMSGTPMPHGPLDIFGQYRAIDPGIFGTSATRFRIKYGADVQFRMEGGAQPPAEKLKAILANSPEFAATWNRTREDIDYSKPFNADLALTLRLMAVAWTDQEIVDALIANRQRHDKTEPLGRGHYIAVLAAAKKKKGYPVAQYSNLEDLRARMDKIRLYIDRDVLDLPEAISVVKHVTLTDKEERVHKELERDLVAEIEAGRITAKNALTKLLKLQQAICGWAKTDDGSEVRLGVSRQEALAEILEDCGCPGGEAAVVFCRFHHDLNAVHEAASGLGVRSCELSGRVNELEEWQADGGPEVLAVQIQAGGLGVDLTRARYSVFYSLGYSLGDYEQALARVHRPGQGRKVTHLHLVAPGTVDEHVYAALEAKKDVIEFVIQTLGSNEPAPEDAGSF